MVGDTMATDIVGGLQMGCRTVLVLSGSTTTEALARYAYAPTEMVRSIADLVVEAEGGTAAAVKGRRGRGVRAAAVR
jgi:ribonucleotide monophosphatase NagD (HAD superfamily)